MRTITFSILMMFVLASTAVADPSAEKSVGVGLGVGVATGLNVQVAATPVGQLDIGFGRQLDDRVRLQTDYAWRLIDLSASHQVALPLYLGLGGFWSDRTGVSSDGGLRMPVGLQADFARAPIQVFGELAPELVLVQASDRTMSPVPGTIGMSGLVGMRAGF